MPKFGKRSKERLATCKPELQELMNELIKIMDVTILCGHRDEEAQNKAYADGFSKLQFPNSKHNSIPSHAVDVAPWNGGINWNDINTFERMCGIVEGIAQQRNIKIRMGRDFSFKDYPHVELLEE